MASENNKTLGILTTSSGILIAILLVWVPNWISTGGLYIEHGQSTITVGYGLAFVYWAIFASTIAFFVFTLKRAITNLSLILLGFALTITVVEVGQSLYSTISKLVSGYEVLYPHPVFLQQLAKLTTIPNYIVLIGLPIILFLIWTSIVIWIPFTKKWFSSLSGWSIPE